MHFLNFAQQTGRGIDTWAQVFKAQLGVQTVAVKMLAGQNDPAAQEQFCQEIAILRSCRCANVVMFCGACVSGNKTMIVCEYMEGAPSLRVEGPPFNARCPFFQWKVLSFPFVEGARFPSVKDVSFPSIEGASKLRSAGLNHSQVTCVNCAHPGLCPPSPSTSDLQARMFCRSSVNRANTQELG